MRTLLALSCLCFVACSAAEQDAPPAAGPFSDYRTQKPGARHRITPKDLPKPYATESVDLGPRLAKRPQGAMPQVPAGFAVELFAEGLDGPRLIRTAPNGDIFVVESEIGRITVLRGSGKSQQRSVYTTGLSMPFGVAWYPNGADPKYLYVANTDSVVRFPYANGDLKARGTAETIVPNVPGFGRLRGGGHWTRDIAFSQDGKRLFISVGSLTNVDDPEVNKNEHHRADILVATPEGKDLRVFASGIRNPVGIAVHPQTGELWTSVNERDGLGDNLVPDYITRVQEGGFYGWPYYYIGANQDPRHKGKKPELASKVIVPDVLLQPHNASLQMTFYTGTQFPAEYRGHAFAAQHGSWNRAIRTGYNVVRVPVNNGRATGEYEEFMTGFVLPNGDVWGRPVGVTVAQDGSLLVSEDAGGTIWRVYHRSR